MSQGSRKIGAGGTAESTVRGKKYGLHQLYAFLDTKDDTIDVDLSNLSTRDVKKYERMFCSVEFWQEFAGYLCDVAVTKHKEEDLSLGTAKQYLSACKETGKI